MDNDAMYLGTPAEPVTFLSRPVTPLVEYTLGGKTYVQVEFQNGSTGDIEVTDDRLAGYVPAT